MLQDIVADPFRATALGSHEGEDLVDLLLRLAPLSSGAIKQAQVLCLMCFDDPRVSEFLVAEFESGRDAKTILHLGSRLSLIKEPEFFLPFLWDAHSVRALAAARQCSRGLELTPKERLRVALLLDQDFEPPPLSEATVGLWMNELRGPHRARARKLAGRHGPGCLVLWTRFSEFASAEREWLLSLTAELGPDILSSKLPDLLTCPDVSRPTVELAVELGVELPPSLLRHADPRVRAAAIQVGLADEQIEDFLSTEVSPMEAAAAAGRCSLERRLRLLSDSRWQVRTAAVAALSGQEVPIEEVRKRTESVNLGERVASIELLRRLGDTEWLQGQLVG